MALDLHAQFWGSLSELRHAPTTKRLRASLDGTPVVDTAEALLVWEPRRVVPEYAVPADAIMVDLVEVPRAELPASLPAVLGPPGFELHTCPGTALGVRVGEGEPVEVAFRPDDPALGGRVVLSFARFDWLEEDEPVMGHAHDPFKRIDTLRSDRHVVVELDGTVLADSTRATALFETYLPPRWYLPREDVHMDLMSPSDHHSVCAYKGVASYLSADVAEGQNIAWYYPQPLHDALPVRDLVAFWSERATVTVDGQPVRGAMPDLERG